MSKPGTVFSIDRDTLALVRGVCQDDPRWTMQAFVTAAIKEKIERDGLTPTPRYTVRMGRPPRVKA